MGLVGRLYEKVLRIYTKVYCLSRPKISIGEDVIIYPNTEISFRYSGKNSRLKIGGVESVVYQEDIRLDGSIQREYH